MSTQTSKQVVLEESSNTHMVSAPKIVSKDMGDGVMMLNITEGNGVLTHGGRGVVIEGNHGSIGIPQGFHLKYNQIELNPVTNKLQKAFD